MPSWHLADAADVAARHRYTFHNSPPEAIARVRPGEVVKLIFAFRSDDVGAACSFGHRTQQFMAVDE